MTGSTPASSVWKELDTQGSALSGVRVLDLSRVLAGPLCTQMLADHGASVIKVEAPTGDETRRLGPPFDQRGQAAYFNALNRGKYAITLNLRDPTEQAIVFELLKDADVLVENFIPGTMEKWGLGYETVLSHAYPRLIYCSISGFGADGPLGSMPGYDAVIQALSGLMSINGSEESGPMRIGVPLVDHLTAYTAFSGILMALFQRQQTGQAQRVEATLYDTALSLLIPHAHNWGISGKTPALLGSEHPNIAPYGTFKVKDGLIVLGILSEQQFRRFCLFLGHEELADKPEFASNANRLQHKAYLQKTLEHLIQDKDKISLCEQLMSIGVPAAPVNTVPEALQQAHTQHRGMWQQQGEVSHLGLPIRLSKTPGERRHAPPELNQHNFIKERLKPG